MFSKTSPLFIILSILVSFGASLAPAGMLTDVQKRQLALEMYADYRNSFPEVGDIDAHTAMGLLSEPDVVFVDVRRPNEQKVSMIPGAIKKEEFMDQIEKYRTKRIIAYCTISYRSGKFASKLRRKGIFITNLEAGLLGWVHAGGPLVRQNQSVQRLHVYGRKWDLAPAAIDTVY